MTEPLPAQPIDPPTLTMTSRINHSPLAGTEGDRVQSRVIRERLLREAEGDVTFRISDHGRRSIEVAGRGEFRLGILIGPCVEKDSNFGIAAGSMFQHGPAVELLEPMEEVVIDVDDEHAGIIVQKLAEREAEMVEMRPSGGGRVRLIFYAPTRG